MKSLSNFLHKTPWWALLAGGLAAFVALAVFVTPFHIIQYRKDGATPEETRAIKREIDNAFAENAIDVARGVILSLRGATSDAERRAELTDALQELENAREELRSAGREVLRAKREALETTQEAVKSASESIQEASRQAERALKDAGVDNARVKKALEDSLKAAKEAEEEARRSLESGSGKRIVIGMSGNKDKPLLDVEVGDATPGQKAGIEIAASGDTASGPKGPSIRIDSDGIRAGVAPVPPVPPIAQAPGASVPPAPPAPPALPSVDPVPPLPPLPPELRSQIREKVTGDMYRIATGAALILILLPIFVLAVISKFFIDRSRAAQRLAELKRKEAEFHRMGQQVTEAKLQALQAQVEPHFLYNTLASVQALTEVDPQQANAMTGHLIQYLRNALPKMREGVSTVGQEVELVRAYLNILQMRMGKRLAFEITVPASLTGVPFPPLMLPSLVENCIKHGLEPLREGGSVHIGAQAQDGKLRLTVADTGRGFGESIGDGVGLTNIRERLLALYGEAGKLILEENSPRGVIATIEVPLEGARPAPAPPASEAPEPAAPAKPVGAAAKTLHVMGAAERAWRKTLSFAFVAMVIVAAVVAGLGIFGTATGIFPVEIGDEKITGAGGALIGTAGIAVGFAAVVLALAIVVAVLYGLGFVMVGILIFVPVVILIALVPPLAPFILVGLFIWWLVRRSRKRGEARAPKVEPTLGAAGAVEPATPAPPPDSPPPVPPQAPDR